MATPWPKHPPTADDRGALTHAAPRSFWLDDVAAAPACEPLRGAAQADLAIVGAGYMGLWTAIHAKRDDPSREVVILEAARCGHGASGRNGGFLEASLTHGLANGVQRFGDELVTIERLARTNFDELLRDLDAFGIDADVELGGVLLVMLEDCQQQAAAREAAQLQRFGYDAVALSGPAAARAELRSPLVRAAVWQRSGAATLHPVKLAFGLRRVALELGVRLYEHSPVRALARSAPGVRLTTDRGHVDAHRVVLATNAHRSLLRGVRRRIVPVYDYALVTEPLTAEQLASIGWRHRQGVADFANQFHYLRLTADNRILIGGYDAIYRFGSPVGPQLDQAPATFARLSQHFFTLFPQLRGVRFTHQWGGAIDTCSRFSVFFGTEHRGRVSYAAGFTGLGVAATRFGARVALDLVDGRATPATVLRFVQQRPLAFPPEPLRYAAIQYTRRQLARADEHEGRRGAWLRLLDRVGVGFDS